MENTFCGGSDTCTRFRIAVRLFFFPDTNNRYCRSMQMHNGFSEMMSCSLGMSSQKLQSISMGRVAKQQFSLVPMA